MELFKKLVLPKVRILTLTPNDVIWPMGRQDNVPEYQCTSPEDKYPRTFKVDPFPCYTHDEERVKVMADLCQNAFPVPNLNIYILSHEMIDRINGLSYEQPSYS